MRILPYLFVLFLLSTTACNSQSKITSTTEDVTTTVDAQTPAYKYAPPAVEGEVVPIDEPDSYWKGMLSSQAFNVLRQDGTERPFTSPLNDEKRAGIFTCAACGLPVYNSDAKFKSGTGWPSFFQPVNAAYVKQDVDNRGGMRRLPRRPQAYRPALLHQRRLPQLRPDGRFSAGRERVTNSRKLSFLFGRLLLKLIFARRRLV
jgi:peptide-methionine (R)-S-oxide reductase